MLPVREIHTSDVHPILNELQEDLRGPADGADGADDAGEPHLVGRGVHVEVGDILDVGVTLPRSLLASGHIALLQDRLENTNHEVSCQCQWLYLSSFINYMFWLITDRY